jgi:FtsZ-interacting cell division protein ZipA
MSELRWTLLILGAVFVAALAWWERHRPRQAGGAGAEPRAAPRELPAEASQPRREPSLTLPTLRARDPLMSDDLPVLAAAGESPAGAAPAAAPALADGELTAAGVPLECLPRLPPAAAPQVDWPPDERRRVLALRLVAMQPERFAGRSLRQALVAEGFVLGRFAIFHKPDEEQRAVLSAASLSTPGTFDEDTMDSQHYGGLSLFAVLPGPKPPPEAFDELLLTARSLNERLQGALQDELGSPLTPVRIALLRERLSGGASA